MGFILSLLERVRLSLQKDNGEAALWLNVILQEYQSLYEGHRVSIYSEKNRYALRKH